MSDNDAEIEFVADILSYYLKKLPPEEISRKSYDAYPMIPIKWKYLYLIIKHADMVLGPDDRQRSDCMNDFVEFISREEQQEDHPLLFKSLVLAARADYTSLCNDGVSVSGDNFDNEYIIHTSRHTNPDGVFQLGMAGATL